MEKQPSTKLVLSIVTLLFYSLAFAESAKAGQFIQIGIQDEAIDGYTLWIPASYDPGKAYPLILSLHSSGETGGSPKTALIHGPGPSLLRTQDRRFDALRSSFIIVFPHLKEGPYAERQWFDRTETLDDILIDTLAEYSCDMSRIYVLGYSTGGTGSWGYASSHPLDFAAIVPVAGFTKPDLGIKKPVVRDWKALANVPVWAIYNVFDKAVSYNHVRNAISELESQNGQKFITLTHAGIGAQFRESVVIDTEPGMVLGQMRISSIYKIGIHSEGNVFANPLIYDWLLSHRNKRFTEGILFRKIAQKTHNQLP